MGSISTADGAVIAFEEHGGGRPIVLLHGITESRRAWDPVLDGLAAHARVVGIDLRGHGASERRPPYDAVTMAGDVRAVVDALDLETPLVVGHSMGGVVASAYGGLGHPARGLVNIDQPLELGGFKAALDPIRPVLEGDEAGFREAVAMVFGVLDGPLPATERARLDAIASPEQDVVLGVWGTVLDHSTEELDAMVLELLAGLRSPYLAIHGSDPGVAYVEWFLARVTNARIEVWPEHGHYPHLVDPAHFVARVEQFDGGL